MTLGCEKNEHDFQQAVNQLQGDCELFRLFADAFVGGYEQWLKDVKNAFSENHHDELKRLIHTYKGFAGQIGALSLTILLTNTYRKVIAGEGLLPDELENIHQEIERTVKALCHFLHELE